MVRAFENELLFEAQNFGKETYNNCECLNQEIDPLFRQMRKN